MDYIKNHLQLIYALAFLALVSIFFIVAYNWNLFGNPGAKLNIVKTEIDIDKLPELFPEDVPIEKDAKITQNYNATAEDGRFQATRAFETKKSLADNLKTYQDYFKTGGWVVGATVDTENYKLISGTRDTYWIQVAISNNTVSGIKTVDISLTKEGNK